jgi:hypothetical protein
MSHPPIIEIAHAALYLASDYAAELQEARACYQWWSASRIRRLGSIKIDKLDL